MPVFGPGTLTIGATGTPIDASCLVNSLSITHETDKKDDTTKLCGTVKAGAITFTYKLEGNVDLDTEAGAAGLFALSHDAAGSVQDFTYTANTADGTTATGQVIIEPLDFGGDEYGVDLASDLSWGVVGTPAWTYGTGGAAADGELVGADA